MASVEQLTVQFSGKGAPKLTGQINALAAAMNRLAAIQGKHAKATTQVTAAQQKLIMNMLEILEIKIKL